MPFFLFAGEIGLFAMGILHAFYMRCAEIRCLWCIRTHMGAYARVGGEKTASRAFKCKMQSAECKIDVIHSFGVFVGACIARP